MAFIMKDNIIYDELLDVTPAADVVKGEAHVENDTFGFYNNDEDAGNECALIYRCRQVLADKAVGTGEDINSGERLYYYPATDTVSPNAVGTAGTDYYFCGWAKEDAAAAATTVLMNFDGTRYDEAV